MTHPKDNIARWCVGHTTNNSITQNHSLTNVTTIKEMSKYSKNVFREETMNTISNYSLYNYSYNKKIETKKEEKDLISSLANLESNHSKVVDCSMLPDNQQSFIAKAYDEQNSFAIYIGFSAQPLNNTLTSYRDLYPNIIGFTAKTQSSLSSLLDGYRSKLFGLTTKFASCKTEEDFKRMMKELKDEIAKLMREFNAKLNTIAAITAALPAFSDVRDKSVGSDIDMHDKLEAILKGITTSDNSKSSSNTAEAATQEVGQKLDRETISEKLQEMQTKNKEYKEKLKIAQESGNQAKIKENQSLITGTQKLIDVYSTVLKGIEALVSK